VFVYNYEMARIYLILPLFCVSCMVVKPLEPKFDKMHISVHILPLNQVAAKCKMGPVNGCARVLSNSFTLSVKPNNLQM